MNESGYPVVGAHHRKPIFLEDITQHTQNDRVIIDDEDRKHWLVRGYAVG